jgi:hypothetical protein
MMSLKRFIVIFLAIVIVLVCTGCGVNPEKIQETELSQSLSQSLTQSFEHSDYSVKLPQSWKVTKDSEESNPTLYFEVEQKQAGGLFLLRLDKLEELPSNRKEIVELRSSTHQVFKYSTQYESAEGTSDATAICFYVPAKNSGYEFIFVNDSVSDALAHEIARTVKIK